MAPVLFTLHIVTMAACWRSHCSKFGITVKYRTGRRLVENRTFKTRLEETKITESKFDDDVALYAVTRQAVEREAATFVTTATECGALTVSL